jgi:N6-L-threonylcarbamoyladenine synthase
VASNQFLKTILRTILDQRGYGKIRLVFPPPKFCTDNAAMIAWTGIEMYEAGLKTSLEVSAIRKWGIDPKAEDGGILGADGWERRVL